jgi:hypothetical protein
VAIELTSDDLVRSMAQPPGSRCKGSGTPKTSCKWWVAERRSPARRAVGVFETGRKAGRPSPMYCGDDSSSKELAAELIGDVVFDSVHAGPLRIAHYTEPFALLVAQLAH